MLVRRLAVTFVVVTGGYAVARVAGIHDLQQSQVYLVVATGLLAIGLFGSTYGIDPDEVSRNKRIVFVAVTLGVMLKAALIAGVMYAVFRDPAFIVLGVAVAQIDPLSVAAMREHSRLSPRARAILSAWSSFDDPVTAVLAVVLASVAVGAGFGTGAAELPDGAAALGGVAQVGLGLVGNAVVVGVLAVVWFGLLGGGRRIQPARLLGPGAPTGAGGVGDAPEPRLRLLAVAILLVVAAAAVHWVLLLGLAVAGLFYRPGIGAALERLVSVAFWVALCMLGLVLADGVRWLPGLLLGVTAFGAQIVTGALVTRSLPGSDRARLALSQQNGITAVILALLLEAVIPGTVAVVAPAVLVVNVLHLLANQGLDRFEDRPVRRPAQARRPGARQDTRRRGPKPEAA